MPDAPLLPAKCYLVRLGSNFGVPGRSPGNRRSGLKHSRRREWVIGSLSWMFYTIGYEPLRVISVFPSPFTTVSVAHCVIAVSLSAHPIPTLPWNTLIKVPVLQLLQRLTGGR